MKNELLAFDLKSIHERVTLLQVRWQASLTDDELNALNQMDSNLKSYLDKYR